MHIWTDSKGRQWPIRITWPQLRILRASVDSLDELIGRMEGSPGLDEMTEFSGLLLTFFQTIDPTLTAADFDERTEKAFPKLCEVFVAELLDFFRRQGLKPATPPTKMTPPPATTSETDTTETEATP